MRPARVVLSMLLVLVVSALLVFLVEVTVRGSVDETVRFLFEQPLRPGLATIVIFGMIILALDALLGRAYHALLVLAPITLALAFTARQKANYLGDPLYPTDFLYSRQIIELMPLLVRERPLAAALFATGAVAVVVLTVLGWRYGRRRSPRLSWAGRAARLAIAVPALAFFASMMDYASFSWARDRLQIVPIMWDQKENYSSNGFAIAFALNVPMANVKAPAGYSPEAVKAIEPAAANPTLPSELPDIVVVMSESFWDPTRLDGVSFSEDPLPTARANLSGHVLSPEFGGLTANVEFEAITGLSNAFLPAGSIPYQQYVRGPVPTLASFLRDTGYETIALHPFAGWFWNRAHVYRDFGFDKFLSEESLPALAQRGPLASDAAMTEVIIDEMESHSGPAFMFAVSLQGHGPYPAGRYPDDDLVVTGSLADADKGALESYAIGIRDADRGLQRLLDWAATRDRHTIVVFFGDHLPPLANVFVSTGYMKGFTADRRAPWPTLAAEHETPLVVWSNRSGPARDLGTVSPAFLPNHILKLGGFTHPFYTGFLGEVHDRFRVVDRQMLVGRGGETAADWSRGGQLDPRIRDYRLLQYDLLFGGKHSVERLFEQPAGRIVSTVGSHAPSCYFLTRCGPGRI
jgi:phosphoglycerol transferase MdoB-like AlkP superfamily enzyme